ncbi:hypothetical protein HWV00_02965 [Moritella sp. 24]|uniref:hypothetical protein n=1 Tax=Moritella sp. 24 TaxID=2746230 RepID=UPI001BACC88D|nr:hypothetical protein [Moritella sp. 24]QUM75274.1 hypothetical protein HWV00_02965 [Moritella sp. 24]
MFFRNSLYILLLATITACSHSEPEPIGGDRDEHGCLPAAGYLWCERTQTCERSWELADAAKIEHTEAEVKAYCEIIDSDLFIDDEE